MISILLDNQQIFIEDNCTLSFILERYDQLPECYAVAVNSTFVPRKQYAGTKLKESDVINIIIPMQGG